MSLFTNEDHDDRGDHPLDVIESLAVGNDWLFDRDGEDEITITVGGGWSEYHVSFTWLEDVEALHIACAFELKINERRRTEALKLISLINEQLWVGHFGIWDKENMLIFRHALVLAGGLQPQPAQCAAILQAAVASCERYYQSFQFVLWAGKTAQEALAGALFETAGEA